MPTTELVADAPAIHEDSLLTEEQAAELIQFSPHTLRCWRSDGEGPKWCRVGKRAIRYKRSDLQDWIRTQESQQ